MGFLTNIKNIGIFLISLLSLVGLWKYHNKVEENEELKSYADKKAKEANALKETIIVQEKVQEQKVANVVMEKEVSNNEVEIVNKQVEKTAKVSHTVQNAMEGEEFNLKA